MPLDPAQLHEAQGSRAGVAVDRQGRQAQQAKVLGREIRPGMGFLERSLRSGVRRRVWGVGVGHKGSPVRDTRAKYRAGQAFIGRFARC
ncbi:hypothetical protein D9M69_633090 [compost metagenome]